MGNICILMPSGFQRLKVGRMGDLSENLKETVSIKKVIKTTGKDQSEVKRTISANRDLHPVCPWAATPAIDGDSGTVA